MIKSKLITIVTLMSLLAGCNDNNSDSSHDVPVASAGTDQSVNENSAVTLSGTADVDGGSATYRWAQTSGTTVTIADKTTAIITFNAPDVSADETLNFTLTVTDEHGQSATNDVDVMVTNVPVAPVAAAGSDQTVDEDTSVTLTASGTSDDGTITGYSWLQTAGTTVTLTDDDTASATFTAPTVSGAETLTFEVTITDSNDNTATDSLDVVVENAPVGPLAAAGDDQSVEENTSVILTGSGTSAEATITAYSWVQTGTPTVTLSGADTAMATYTAPDVDADTVLTFKLTVTDSNANQATDVVQITVTDAASTGDVPLYADNLKLWLPFEATTLTTLTKQKQADTTGITVSVYGATLKVADFTGSDVNTTANKPGKSGRAVNLLADEAGALQDTTSGGKIEIATDTAWATPDKFTVSFWFKNASGTKFSKTKFGLGRDTYGLAVGYYAIELGQNADATAFKSPGVGNRAETADFFPFDQWVFFTSTYVDDGTGNSTGTFTLYQDGNFWLSKADVAESLAWTFIQIANKGLMDDFRIYDRGITALEVTALFDSYDTFDSDGDGTLDKEDDTPFGDDFTEQ